LLLICIYRIAKEKDLPVFQTIAPLIFSDNMGEPKFNLDIPERLPMIEALFNGTIFNIDGKDESIQTMFSRYKDIESNDFIVDLGDKISHFAYWLMNKVGLIEIATDNDNYAYAIFETMNDRGKPLSQVDLLKAYLLIPIVDADKRREANQVWKKQVLDLISWEGKLDAERDANCIKAWFRAQYAESIRDRKPKATDKDWELTSTVFHRWARDNNSRLNLGTESNNLKLIIDDFPFFAKAYQKILHASQTYLKGLEAVFYNAHNDFTWQNTVLLAPLVITDDDDTVRRKIAVTATYLDIWLMRRVVNYIRVGYSSISYTMWLLCCEIRRKSLDELVEILSKKLDDDEVTFKGSPIKGRGGVAELALNQFSRRYIFHLLARITAFTDMESGRAVSFDKYVDRSAKNPFDIEHIWANDFAIHNNLFVSEQEFLDYRDRIASLLLLPADVNRSLQANAFAAKLHSYAKQNIYTASLDSGIYQNQPQFNNFKAKNNLSFKSFSTFGKAEQQERQKLVEELVNLVWSTDRLKEAVNDNYRQI
ncbi:MAG: DUF262 domain-containing protein, partial [bacterium]